MKGLVPFVLGLIFAGHLNSSKAADSFWKGANGGDFFNANNWYNGVPGRADNARFTNSTQLKITWSSNAANAGAFFNGSGGAVTQSIASQRWTLTNKYVLGELPGSSATVVHESGTLIVTNAGGTARLIMGQSGNGVFDWKGGTVLADKFLATNLQNPTIIFDHGELTTKSGSRLELPFSQSGNPELLIGNTAGKTFAWNILGGVNSIQSNDPLFPGVRVWLGASPGSRGLLRVSGPTTIWQWRGLTIGSERSSGDLTIEQGAQGFVPYMNFGGGSPEVNSASSSILITGPGSRLKLSYPEEAAGYLVIYGSSNRMSVANGGAMETGRTYLFGAMNTVAVTGAGTVWTNLGEGAESFQLHGWTNTVLVSDGGLLHVNGYFEIGAPGEGNESMLLVRDGGSVIVPNYDFFPGIIQVGSFAARGILEVAGGSVTTETLYVNYGDNSVFRFKHGTVTTAELSGNGILDLTVGNGTQVATLNLLGSLYTTHFVKTLIVASNAVVNLSGGNLFVVSDLTVANGPSSSFNFQSGQLMTRSTTISNGVPFRVGNGVEQATLYLDGGNHSFANGLIIRSNSVLQGSGTIVGNLTLREGATWQVETSARSCPPRIHLSM